MTYRRLAAVTLLVLGTAAFAAGKAKPLGDPCADKGSEVQEKCSAECFKVDPNKADQTAGKSEMRCMAKCQEKSAKVLNKCAAEQQAKANAKEGKSKEEKAQTELDAL